MENKQALNTIASNRRIAKNTLILYVRMAITMLVQLYTSRIVLQALGVDDYGIYNIVGTVVVMFSFINGPLGTATQRFFNFELVKPNEGELNKIFNISLIIFLVLAVVMLLVMEPCGIWYVGNRMNMPVERTGAAMAAFQFSLFSFLVSFVKVPYESMIIANERMSFFAYISIGEVLLKLGNAFSLTIFGFDKLILFTFNQFAITVICFLCIVIYSNRQFLAVRLRLVWDRSIFRSLLSFSGWSLFGSVASMSSEQGVSLVINNFCGVAVNAAVGVANQVSASVNQFVANFQVAFRPQLVMLYANNEIEALKSLIFNSAKYSYLLLFAIACPFMFNVDFLLKAWLGIVPEYANHFVVLNIVYLLLETLSAPLWMVIQATGKIKRYQLAISSVMSLNIVFAYLLLRSGFPPYAVMAVKCLLDVVYFAIRLLFVRAKIGISLFAFAKRILVPVAAVTVLGVAYYCLYGRLDYGGWKGCMLGATVFLMLYAPTVLFLCVSKRDRTAIVDFVRRKMLKFC